MLTDARLRLCAGFARKQGYSFQASGERRCDSAGITKATVTATQEHREAEAAADASPLAAFADRLTVALKPAAARPHQHREVRLATATSARALCQWPDTAHLISGLWQQAEADNHQDKGPI